MSRLPDRTPATMSAEQRRVHDAIASGPRGYVAGPLKAWLESPGFANRAQALGEELKFRTALAPKLAEVAIMTTARHWTAQYEWYAHRPLALKAGVTEADLATIAERRGERHDFGGDALAHDVHLFARDLLAKGQVDDALYGRVAGRIGPAQAVELVGFIGYYTTVALTINAFAIALPEGEPTPLGR